MSGRGSRGGGWGAAGILVAVFGAGGLAGAAVMEIMHDTPETPAATSETPDRRSGRSTFGQSERFMHVVKRHLDLTEEQETEIMGILERNEREARDLFNGIRPQLEAGVNQTRAQIREALTDAQRTKFDKMISDERGRRRRGPPRGERPPPSDERGDDATRRPVPPDAQGARRGPGAPPGADMTPLLRPGAPADRVPGDDPPEKRDRLERELGGDVAPTGEEPSAASPREPEAPEATERGDRLGPVLKA